MPDFSPGLARIARFTVLVVVGLALLWGAIWQGWWFGSDRQYRPRQPNPSAIAVPAGYQVEMVTQGLNAPSALEISADGTIYIAESGYGGAYAATAGVEGATPGRILRLNPDGTRSVVAGDFSPPIAGLTFDGQRNLYVSHGGTVSVLTAEGRKDIVTGLPSLGDHKNNQVTIGPDGKLYIAQGTVTNAGIVGLDNWALWGRYYDSAHDVPCRDIVLRGENVRTGDPRSILPFSRVQTGAFASFGHSTLSGQVIKGEVPCNGAILRTNLDGTGMEVVAWGLRNPFGLRFGPGNQLYTTDNGPDTRGSRSVEGPDLFHRVRPGAWYGWPDYWNGKPASGMSSGGRERAAMLLAKLPAQPQPAFMALGQHVGAAGFDFAPASFGFEGQAFIAEFGTGFPATSQKPSYDGFNVIRVDLQTQKSEVFATNRRPGPASLHESSGGFERPVAVRFSPDGSLYVLDWGHLSVTKKGPYHVPDGGVLWRIRKVGPTGAGTSR